MFEYLKNFSKILVTGPQRAGTTICAKMIAIDTGHRYIDEDETGIHSFPVVNRLVSAEKNIVVHCPASMHMVHLLGLENKELAVVIVHRAVEDIEASQERIKWSGEKAERAKYNLQDDKKISAIKYEYFDNFQREYLRNVIDVNYEDLNTHHLWIAKKERENFGARQTQ